MILAAGFGTRLFPLTSGKSKVVLPLAGVPVIVRVIRLFRELGVDDFVVNLHHASHTVRDTLSAWGEKVTFSLEERIMGTGGALHQAKEFFSDRTFLLVNGDCYYEGFPLAEALEFHRERKALATMVLMDLPEGSDYKAVKIDKCGHLVQIAGRPEQPSAQAAKRLHFTGIHILEPEILQELPPGFSEINRDIYPVLIARKAPVFGFHTSFRWFDLGTPGQYLEAVSALLSPEAKPGASVLVGKNSSIDPQAGLLPPLEIGPRARIGPGCRLHRAVLGEGVTVEKDVVIENSLVGDNLHLEAGLRLCSCVVAEVDGVREIRRWE